MEFLSIWVLPLIGGLIWYWVTQVAVKAPGDILASKFSALTKDTGGVIAGKTYREIVDACGAPASVSSMGDGQKLCQWMATSYHIALLFDENDVCLGISHEAKV